MKRTRHEITEKDRNKIIKLYKEKKTATEIHKKLPRYNTFQIGAIKQHMVKGSYRKRKSA